MKMKQKTKLTLNRLRSFVRTELSALYIVEHKELSIELLKFHLLTLNHPVTDPIAFASFSLLIFVFNYRRLFQKINGHMLPYFSNFQSVDSIFQLLSLLLLLLWRIPSCFR